MRRADNRGGGRGAVRWTLALALAALACGPVLAQSVEIEPLLWSRELTALLEHDGVVLGGLRGGGLLRWTVEDPETVVHITAGNELSGNDVTGLAWTGHHVWVATLGGGLTRITDLAGTPEFWQFADDPGALAVTSVTGGTVGGEERVFFGLDGDGLGRIDDGFPYTVYTTNAGLVSNDVNAVAMLGEDLYVGTDLGVSRFADNLFTTVNDGLADVQVNALAVSPDGRLFAGTPAGLYVLDAEAGTWSVFAGQTADIRGISVGEDLFVITPANARAWDGAAWRFLSLPEGTPGAVHAGSAVWLGGTAGLSSGSEYVIRPAYRGRLDGAAAVTTWDVPGSQVFNPGGVVLAGDMPVLGFSDWLSVLSYRTEAGWSHVGYNAADVPPRLTEGLILDMDDAPDGSVWFCLYYGTGLARLDPATGAVDLVPFGGEGLQGRAIVGLTVHPDGAVITTHDQEDDAKVEILVDPDDPYAAASWLTLPNAELGAVTSTDVWDALVESRDVIWFAVSGVGLVRWDINGPDQGPDDPLTWFDDSDDAWARIVSVPGASQGLTGVRGLALSPDGSIWAGGSGVVQFRYDPVADKVTGLTSLVRKDEVGTVGLISNNVSDVVCDANGHAWVTTDEGLNRVRGRGASVAVDAYFDLPGYLARPENFQLYSIAAIRELPGLSYGHLSAGADGRRVLVAGTQGAALITVGEGSSGTAVAESAVYAYPNPYRGGTADGGLKLGGLPDGVVAEVEIYNLDGQLVYRDRQVQADTGFWTGINRVGSSVATGMYVVRVTVDGASRAIALSVVK